MSLRNWRRKLRARCTEFFIFDESEWADRQEGIAQADGSA